MPANNKGDPGKTDAMAPLAERNPGQDVLQRLLEDELLPGVGQHAPPPRWVCRRPALTQ